MDEKEQVEMVQGALAELRAIAVVTINAVDQELARLKGEEVDESELLDKGLEFAIAAFAVNTCDLLDLELVDGEAIERMVLAMEDEADRVAGDGTEAQTH